jgi:hypothetical protein
MFCPSCGSEERQASQFCRACGTDLRPVRMPLKRPDSITASAVSAREEIGRAVADHIRQVEDEHDLKRFAEDVLPEIEKFLESYEEKRLRRMRTGVIVAASGLGTCGLGLILSAVMLSRGPGAAFAAALVVLGLGVITAAVGVGLVLNGILFTKPLQLVEDNSSEARLQNLLDAGYAWPQLKTGGEASPSFRSQTTSNLSQPSGSSVTEHTTHHLKSDR